VPVNFGPAPIWEGIRNIGDAVPWESWFAWRPVKVHGQSVWLKTVYRRANAIEWPHDSLSSYSSPTWQYGTIFDVLTAKTVLNLYDD